MTNKIEQEFFKTFGIEPISYSRCTSDYCISADKPYPTICKKCPYYTVYKIDYPPITDRILLELICILSGNITLEIKVKNIKELKEGILKHAIERSYYALNKEKYKAKVRKLFESEEE